MYPSLTLLYNKLIKKNKKVAKNDDFRGYMWIGLSTAPCAASIMISDNVGCG